MARVSDTLNSKFGREYAAGDVLFREGETGDVMFVIQSGEVAISKSVGGSEKILAKLGPGEFFGEMAILNGKPRTATARVVTAAKVLVIEARTLEEMLARNAEIALRLIKKLAKRLDSADTLVEILLHRDPKARVLLALTRHAEAFGAPVELPSADPAVEPTMGVRVNVSVADLAREVATEESVAYEMMKRVGRLGIAYEEEAHIIVTDIERLEDFVDFLNIPQPKARPDTDAPSVAERAVAEATRSIPLGPDGTERMAAVGPVSEGPSIETSEVPADSEQVEG
ncbi:MAG: Crp/Fnr family transcriptional regulator [Polyangiaceae bacterium]